MEPIIAWHIYDMEEDALKKETIDRFFRSIEKGDDLAWLENAIYSSHINLNATYDRTHGDTPLIFAIKHAKHKNRDKVIGLLLSPAHILVNRTNQDGDTALHIAIINDDAETFMKLLYKHADIEIKNNSSTSPIDLLTNLHCPNISDKLVNSPPKWLLCDDNYTTFPKLLKAVKSAKDTNKYKTVTTRTKMTKTKKNNDLPILTANKKELYLISSELKPRLREKYFFYTKVKWAVENKDIGSLLTSLMQASSKSYPWVVHNILLNIPDKNESLLKKCLTSTNHTKNKETNLINKYTVQTIETLIEHGLDAQYVADEYYMRWLTSNCYNKENQNSKNFTQMLQKYGGSMDTAGIRYRDKLQKIIKPPPKRR